MGEREAKEGGFELKRLLVRRTEERLSFVWWNVERARIGRVVTCSRGLVARRSDATFRNSSSTKLDLVETALCRIAIC